MYILPVLGSLDIHHATKIGPKITKKIFFFVFCSVDPLNFSVTPKVTYYQKLEVQTLLLVKKKRKIFRGCFEIFWFFVWALSEPQRPPDAVFLARTVSKMIGSSARTFWCMISLGFLWKKTIFFNFCIFANQAQKTLWKGVSHFWTVLEAQNGSRSETKGVIPLPYTQLGVPDTFGPYLKNFAKKSCHNSLKVVNRFLTFIT